MAAVFASLSSQVESGDAMTVTAEPEYEWGIGMRSRGGAHRTGMTEQEARGWVAEAEEDGCAMGAFFVIRRPVGEWEQA